MSDLPILFPPPVPSSASFAVTEAIGQLPDSERTVTGVRLNGDDTHSDAGGRLAVLRNSDRSRAYSCERWIRVRFSPPFGRVSNLRFWVPNLALNPGWQLMWGTTTTYSQPVWSRSGTATRQIPTVDPGFTAPNMPNQFTSYAVGAGRTSYSTWIVLQALWDGVVVGDMQDDPLELRFGWSEI